MSRPVVTPSSAPRSTALVSLTDLKTYLGISGSSLDATLTAYLDATYAAFSEQIGRPLARASYVEMLPGEGGHYLLLSRWPVESVASVTLGIDDPETVTAADYSIASTGRAGSPRRDRLYCADGWSYTYDRATRGGLDSVAAGNAPLSYTATYTAGYLMPDQFEAWTATDARTAATWTRSSDPTVLLRFECTTAGTTGASEPTWPTTVGGYVNDGTAVWTAREASELPADLREAAKVTASSWYRGDQDRDSAIKRERGVDGDEIEYFDTAATASAQSLPLVAVRTLERYR